MNLKRKIINRINRFESKKVFIIKDFLDIANYETVKSTLNRLVEDKEIDKVGRGLYFKPKYYYVLEDYSKAGVEEVITALARKNNWLIGPTGNTSLNNLGLSLQVPGRWKYLIDGRQRKYEYEGITIEFEHAKRGEISKESLLSTMLIQSLLSIGKNKIKDKEIKYLKNKFNDEEKEELLKNCKNARVWVYDIIRRICKNNV